MFVIIYSIYVINEVRLRSIINMDVIKITMDSKIEIAKITGVKRAIEITKKNQTHSVFRFYFPLVEGRSSDLKLWCLGDYQK